MNRIHSALAEGVPEGNGIVLDFGCGDCPNRSFLESRGYKYVGMDNDLKKAKLSVWGDCHNAPFKAGVFDVVASTAVFEHLPDPVAAIKEVKRVLKDGGIFVGSAAFLEPFHSNSHFHMSHLGVLKVLKDGGFNVERIWAGGNVLESQFYNLFPWKGINIISRLFGRMAWWLHLFLFYLRDMVRGKKAYPDMDSHRLAFASAIGFIARKER